MLIEIDDNYVQWIKSQNPGLFAPGEDEQAKLAQSINEVATFSFLMGQGFQWD